MAQQKKDEKRGATGWDFGIALLHFLWNVLDKGFLLPFAAIAFLGGIYVLLLRMPAEDIGPIIRHFMVIFGDRLVIIAVAVVVEFSTVIMWRMEVSYYRNECKRLGDEKSYWVHADPVQKHSSSSYDWTGNGPNVQEEPTHE